MDMLIDSTWRPAVSGARHDVVNPATGAVVDTVAIGGKADAEIAILAASGPPSWTTPIIPWTERLRDQFHGA